jgi:hypothetical protein
MSTATLPRPAERVAIISMLLVFLCGAVLGAVVMSYWGHPALHGALPGKGGMDTMSIEDFSRYFDHLVSDGNTRIVQILNPDQKRKYDQMMAEHKTMAGRAR